MRHPAGRSEEGTALSLRFSLSLLSLSLPLYHSSLCAARLRFSKRRFDGFAEDAQEERQKHTFAEHGLKGGELALELSQLLFHLCHRLAKGAVRKKEKKGRYVCMCMDVCLDVRLCWCTCVCVCVYLRG